MQQWIVKQWKLKNQDFYTQNIGFIKVIDNLVILYLLVK